MFSLSRHYLQRKRRGLILSNASVRTVLRCRGDDDSRIDGRFDHHISDLASGVNRSSVGFHGWGTDLDCQLMASLLGKQIRVVFDGNIVVYGENDQSDPITITFYRNHWQYANALCATDEPRMSFEDLMKRLVS